MRDLQVVKLVATGNDFLFVDARSGLPQAFGDLDRSEISKRLCDRHFGVGADGFVFVEGGSGGDSTGDRLRWDFYNSDGSPAEMCGNASRCFGRWALANTNQAIVTLETVAGVVRVEACAEGIASHLDYLSLKFEPLIISVKGSQKHAILVDTGVPHAVVEIEKIENVANQEELIRVLRFHPRAGERGANVTFLQRRSSDSFSTVTFERGVENFTLSCGTGVLAAAAVGLRVSQEKKAFLKTPGGDLWAEFGPQWKGATLKGPARFIFETNVSAEFFKEVSR